MLNQLFSTHDNMIFQEGQELVKVASMRGHGTRLLGQLVGWEQGTEKKQDQKAQGDKKG